MILFIDDEKNRVDSYAMDLELSAGHEVYLESNIDLALDFFYENTEQIELIILDIMMSPGKKVCNKSTEDGLRTGMVIFNKIKNDFPDFPIIIFTNVRNDSDDNIADKISKFKPSLFLQKKDHETYEFVDKVNAFLQNNRQKLSE